VSGNVGSSIGAFYLLDPPDNIPDVTGQGLPLFPAYIVEEESVVGSVMGIDVTFQQFWVLMTTYEFNSLTFRAIVLNEIPSHSCDASIRLMLQSYLCDGFGDGLGFVGCGHTISVRHLFHGCLSNGNPSHDDFGSIPVIYQQGNGYYSENYDSSLLGNWAFTPYPPTVMYQTDTQSVNMGGLHTTIPSVVPAGSKLWVYTGLDVTIEGDQGCLNLPGYGGGADTCITGGIGSIVNYHYVPE